MQTDVINAREQKSSDLVVKVSLLLKSDVWLSQSNTA